MFQFAAMKEGSKCYGGTPRENMAAKKVLELRSVIADKFMTHMRMGMGKFLNHAEVVFRVFFFGVV